MSTSSEWEIPDNETGLEMFAQIMVGHKWLTSEMNWPDAYRVDRQVKIGAAIADLVVFHVDGSLTIIEIKAANLPLRDYCTGIGQLAYQAGAAVIDFAKPPSMIRRVLAIPNPVSEEVSLACWMAGVTVLPLPTVAQSRSIWKEALRAAQES